MRIAYSFGMVDLLHFGHIRGMKIAFENADKSIFGLVSDEASDAWFGNHVSSFIERQAVLESIRYIDIVMEQKTFDPISNLRIIHKQYPEAIITLYHGNEWGIMPAKAYLESIGGNIVIFDYYEKMSLQHIREVLNAKITFDKKTSDLISTKANTLLALKNQVKKSKIEEILVFTVNLYQDHFEDICRTISENYGEHSIVVRSSSRREDAIEFSNAGHFSSVLGVNPKDIEGIRNAFREVIISYEEDGKIDGEEQIIVQSQTLDVAISGVIFTRDIHRNRDYYVINYDDSGSTDSVTSGQVARVVWLWHDIEDNKIPIKWLNLIGAVREIESIFPHMLLDIEFAITRSNEVVVFQVRPLAAAYKTGRVFSEEEKVDFYTVRKNALKNYNILCGDKTFIFSDMAFWNPSEIIGDNPRCLDYSLYRYIITKDAWNKGLIALGYPKIESELMYQFGNKPYINVNIAFNALIPEAIKGKLRSNLEKYYCEKLVRNPSAHDKIEFEIVFSCYDFSSARRLKELINKGFTKEDIEKLSVTLHNLTKKIIQNYVVILQEDEKALYALEDIRKKISKLGRNGTYIEILNSIRELLDAVIEYGTIQFSRQARCAFIAKSLCESLVTEGYVSRADMELFLASVETVATDFERDMDRMTKGEFTKKEFTEKYGHLRAGTYDIRSQRYDQIDFFLENKSSCARNIEPSIKKEEVGIFESKLNEALVKDGFNEITAKEVIFFIKSAIEQRERFKFEFTKGLSDALEMIKVLGGMVGILCDDMSYLNISDIFSAVNYQSSKEIKEIWEIIIKQRKREYERREKLILPNVIWSVKDFDYIENMDVRPNYITEKSIVAKTIDLDTTETYEIGGKIVLVEKADPGYDWIFSKGISGLVTKYGGAASHMAIRCAEFEIPAAIGCGEDIYRNVIGAEYLLLDCKNEKLCRTNEDSIALSL